MFKCFFLLAFLKQFSLPSCCVNIKGKIIIKTKTKQKKTQNIISFQRLKNSWIGFSSLNDIEMTIILLLILFCVSNNAFCDKHT